MTKALQGDSHIPQLPMAEVMLNPAEIFLIELASSIDAIDP